MQVTLTRLQFFVKIDGFDQLTNYKYFELAEIELFVADILEQAMDDNSDSKGWIGHSGEHFFITTSKNYLESFKQQVARLFEKGIQNFCFSDDDAEKLSLTFNSKWQP